MNVASSNTIKDAANNSLAATTIAITNNVAAVSSFEAETTTFMNALEIADDSSATVYTGVNGSQLWTIMNDEISALKTNGLLSKIHTEYAFIGGTAAQHGVNLVNPSANTITWFGSWVHSSLGALGNGANTYGDTGLIPSAIMQINDQGLTVTIGTNNATTQYSADIGAYPSGTSAVLLSTRRGNNTAISIMNADNIAFPSIPSTDARGVFSATRVLDNSKIYKNGVLLDTKASGGTLPNTSIYIGMYNGGGSTVTSTQRFQGACIHKGFTDAEVVIYKDIINARELALGRKTW